MTRALITGGAGFIGHHLVAHLLENTDWELTLLDRLDGYGNLMRLIDLIGFEDARAARRVQFFYHDLRSEMGDQVLAQLGYHDYVLHLAADTHVDRSIEDPLSFVYSNVVGTCNLLNFVRRVGCKKMVYFSTDEVFGPAAPGRQYLEWDRYKSGNPYAATKAGAEELCLAFHNTYKVPVFITHCMNVFGERQHPEKFIPSTIRKVNAGDIVTIHADATRTIAGSRFYIHARSVAEAVLFLIERPDVRGDKFNIVGEQEIDNLQLAEMIAAFQRKSLKFVMTDFHSARPGHDLRYALDGEKMASMGWKPSAGFVERLEKVARWTLDHPRWQLG